MKKTFLPLLFLLLISVASHAQNAATAYQFGYDIENMTKEEKAALIQSQIIISLNPMKMMRKHTLTLSAPKNTSTNTNGGTSTADVGGEWVITASSTGDDEAPVLPQPWSLPSIFDDSFYKQPVVYSAPAPGFWTITPQEKKDNLYSLAIDPAGTLSRPVTTGNSKVFSKCRRSLLTQDVICNSTYMLGSEGRHYPAELNFEEVLRLESHIRTLITALTNTRDPVSAKNTIRESLRVKMLERLEGGNGLQKIIYLLTDDQSAMASSARRGEIKLLRAGVKTGHHNVRYTGIDGVRHRTSSLRVTVHELIHVLLGEMISVRTLNFGGGTVFQDISNNIELQTVILTNKVLAGIEPPRGFFYHKLSKRFRSINEVNIVPEVYGGVKIPGSSVELDLVDDFIRVPDNIHQDVTSQYMSYQQFILYTLLPPLKKP